jgi:hypothetical protein
MVSAFKGWAAHITRLACSRQYGDRLNRMVVLCNVLLLKAAY